MYVIYVCMSKDTNPHSKIRPGTEFDLLQDLLGHQVAQDLGNSEGPGAQ